MGYIRIQIGGSFDNQVVGLREFSALDHGHADAVAQAIEYLAKTVLPSATTQDHDGRNASILKPSAPAYHAQIPDADKLARACLDAMTSVVYADDKTITVLSVRKTWADVGEKPGVDVAVEGMYRTALGKVTWPDGVGVTGYSALCHVEEAA